MISVITYANLGKGKYRVSFDNGMTCVLYRGEAARLSLSEGCLITEEQYDILARFYLQKQFANYDIFIQYLKRMIN